MDMKINGGDVLKAALDAEYERGQQAVLAKLRDLPDDVVTVVHSAQPFDSVVPSKLIRALAVSIADALEQKP